MAKDIEEILTKSELGRRARHRVNLDGYWGIIRQNEGASKTDKMLEQAIQDEEEKIASRSNVLVFEDNSLPGYGIDSSTMSAFRGLGAENFAMNNQLLRQIWCGLNQTEVEGQPGIPHEFLSAMNTLEILSLYRAFGRLMKYGNMELDKERISREQLKQMPAEQAVSKMVGYGCRHQAVQAMRKRGCSYFPTGKGDLIKRIKPFNDNVKDTFMQLLDAPTRTSPFTVKEGRKWDFNDPCYRTTTPDGKVIALKGVAARDRYIDSISSFMQEVYHRKTQKA
jgi:hypothetical protein